MEGIDVYDEETGQYQWGLRVFWRVGFAIRMRGTRERPVVQKIEIEEALRQIERVKSGKIPNKQVIEHWEDFGTPGLLELRQNGIFRL